MSKKSVFKTLTLGSYGIVAKASRSQGTVGSVAVEVSKNALQQLERTARLRFNMELPDVMLIPAKTKSGAWIGAWCQDPHTASFNELANYAFKPTASAQAAFGDAETIDVEVTDVDTVLSLLKACVQTTPVVNQEFSSSGSSTGCWDVLDVHPTVIKKAWESTGLFISSTSLSSASWEMIKPVYEGVIVPYVESVRDVSADIVDELAAMLSTWKRSDAKLEKNRSEWLAAIVKALQLDVTLLLDVYVDGNHLKCHGHLDAAILEDNRRIGVVEMKTTNMIQATTRALLGCEVLRDLDDKLPEAVGVVSTLEKWTLMRVQDEHVLLEEGLKVDFDENGTADRESVRVLAGKLVSLLSKSTVPA